MKCCVFSFIVAHNAVIFVYLQQAIVHQKTSENRTIEVTEIKAGKTEIIFSISFTKAETKLCLVFSLYFHYDLYVKKKQTYKFNGLHNTTPFLFCLGSVFIDFLNSKMNKITSNSNLED